MDTLTFKIDLLLFFITFIITFVLYPFWINFVYKFQMGEVSRVHAKKQGTPTMGGFIFVFSVAVVTLLLNRSRTQTLLPLFIATLAGLLGLLEDFTKVYYKSGLPGFFETFFGKYFKKQRNISLFSRLSASRIWITFKEYSRIVGSESGSGLETYQKFLIQGTIAGFISYWTYFKLGWDYLWFPLIGNIHIGFLYPILVFIMFIVVLNAVAFTDGLDGLAGGLGLIAFVFFWIISSLLEYNSLAAFCATFVGALLPFLYFNIYPARIFMGNVGSHALGAVLAILAIVTHREIPFLFIAAVFLVDGISSPLQQIVTKITGKRLFRMAPIHHHFEKLDWPETKVTLRFWLFGIFAGFIGVFLALM